MNAAGPPSERTIQRAILRRMGRVLPAEALWFHVPNEITGPPEYVGALLGDGVKPGAPDLILLHRGRAYGLEVKKPGEVPTPEQDAFHARMRAAGCPCVTVWSVRDAEAAWHAWGLPVAWAGA